MKNQFMQRMFWQLMGPSILAAIGLSIANIADSLVVGIRMGSVGLATIGITAPIYMIYAVFYVGLGVGGSVVFARMAGEGKIKEARKIFNMTMLVSVCIGLLFLLAGLFFTKQILWVLGTTPGDGRLYRLSYQYAHILLLSAPVFFINTPLCIFIRNDDNPKLAGIGFAIGNLVDVILNFVFVLGWKMGVSGSIWATVIGQSVSILILSAHLWQKNHIICLHLEKPEKKLLFRVARSGWVVSIQYISQFIFIMLANHILSYKQGDMGLAVLDVVLNVSYMGMLFYNASSDAMQPLVSTFHGERNPEAEKKAFFLSIFYGMILGTILFLTIFLGAVHVCRLFGLKTDEELKLGTVAVRMYCIGGIMAGVNIMQMSYYQSVESNRKAYLISLMRGTVLLYFFTFLCSYWKTTMFFLLFPLTEAGCLLVFLLVKNCAVFQVKEDVPGKNRIYSTMLSKNDHNLEEVARQIEEFCEKFGATMKQTYYVTVTVEEICAAILDHAVSEEKNPLYIFITIIAESDVDFRLCIRDNALAFNPFELKAVRVKTDDDDDDEILGGLGILIVKQKAKSFYYRRYLNFNTLNILV